MKTKGKKSTALVFGVTSDYTFALANALIGLKRHNKKFWDDIIVFHNGVSEDDEKCINKIMPVKFVDLSKVRHFERMVEEDVSMIDKYSVATFYRYECLRLLNDYRRVIWNDVDILIQGDISDLLEYGEQTGLAFSSAMNSFVVGSSLKKLLDEYRMFAPLWNVGIMVLTDVLPDYEKMYDWCIDATKKYKEVLLWPDLAILNLMVQEFEVCPDDIDREKYVCLPNSENAKEATIVHAYGDRKFWNNLYYYKDFPEWQENATEWSKIMHETTHAETPLVSCIMSCYERYDYLAESVFSLLAQSYANFEIIVVLEKSEKQSEIEEVLKEIDDARIKIVKNKRKLGFSASLNVGIDVAEGQYIARMDDDDISLPLRFARQVKYLEEHKEVGIIGSAMIVFGREKGFAPAFCDEKYLKAVTLVESPFKHPTVMMRKQLLDKYNLRYDPDYFTEDYELWSRAVYKFPVANLPEALVCYRSHNQQATSSATNNNEAKIHESHKRVMSNQFKEYLALELSDNELELLQTRKGYGDGICDCDGIARMKTHAINTIIEANDEKNVYDSDILSFILEERIPGVFKEMGLA